MVGAVELFDEVSQQRACDLDGVGGAALGAGRVDDDRAGPGALHHPRQAPRQQGVGVFSAPWRRTASMIPGSSQASRSRVASAVTSRGPTPVPPVVSTTRDPEATASRMAARIMTRLSGTTLGSRVSNPRSSKASRSSGPERSE